MERMKLIQNERERAANDLLVYISKLNKVTKNLDENLKKKYILEKKYSFKIRDYERISRRIRQRTRIIR